MRVYQNAVEAVKETERDLWEMGHRVSTKTYQDQFIEGNPEFETKEIVGYSFNLLDGRDWHLSFEALGMNDSRNCIAYVTAEARARLEKEFAISNPNPGFSWEQRRDVWEKFLDENGQFSYTYPERIHNSNQMMACQEVLRKDKYSRQVVIDIHQGIDHYNRSVGKRIPCTMYYQVLSRNNTTTLIHNMRSCDLYTHFAIDMSISWFIANTFKNLVGDEKCNLIMQFGSFHAFAKDLKTREIF